MKKMALRHVLSWPKLGLEPKFHDAEATIPPLVASENVNTQTDKQASAPIMLSDGSMKRRGMISAPALSSRVQQDLV